MMPAVAILLSHLLVPPDAPALCPVPQPVQGAALACCAVPGGQQCCAQVQDAAGRPLGCGCAP